MFGPPRPPPLGSGTLSGAFGTGPGALRASKYLILARVNALSIPFSGRGPLAPVPTIGTSRLQQAGSVYNGQAVAGPECTLYPP